MDIKTEFALGEVLREKVTGFKGVVCAITLHTTGCIHYGLSPREPASKDGQYVDPAWLYFDETRLERTGEKPVPMADRSATSGPVQEAPKP